MTILAGGALLLFFLLCVIALVLSPFVSDRAAGILIGWLGALCSILLMLAAAARLAVGQDFHQPLWSIYGVGQLSLHIDALSAVFLFAAGLVYLSCCLFAPGRIRHSRSPYPTKRYSALHFALMISVALIFAAGDALTFLISWECMSILTYLLVNHGQERQNDPHAGYIMLAMSEAGFLAVVIAFLMVASGASELSFSALRQSATHLSAGAEWGVFVLALFGFGVKCGLVPVNFWLPRCYTASPAVFVPVLAGVTLNLGFYGILRMNGDLVPLHGIGPGLFALITGSITALVGILYATTENDLKTMLAHSSIENAGIVVAGIGAFFAFRSSAIAVPAAIALTAALYHIVNHSLYKTLLFEGAGEIESALGTRDMDRMGGLIRTLPGLSVVFLAGCLAISASPPFNGFVSEWLTLQTFLRSALLSSALVKVVFALCGAILALTAALAVTCFVRTYAMSFLGIQRGDGRFSVVGLSRRARSSMILLAVACLLLGILPTYVIGVLDRAVEPLAGASATAALVPPFFTATESNGQLPASFLNDFHNLGAQTGAHVLPGRGLVLLLRGSEQNPVVFAMSPSYGVAAVAFFVLGAYLIVGWSTRRRAAAKHEVWAGGIPKLLPEMTYTATGFSNPVRVVFQAIFRPNIVEDAPETVAVHFRTAIRRRRDETHLVDRVVFHPIGDAFGRMARLLAGMHHGVLS
ncbi:MAG: proton-conducting transporter membrane subunit, partial [Bryobacteraceae bacterium]